MACDFRFVHVADLHLGSRFKWRTAEDPALGKKMQESLFESFARIVDRTKDDTDFMIISGDLYDESYMSPRTRYRFAEEAKRYGKPVFLVRGNHDFGDKWEQSIPYPPNVHEFPAEPKALSMNIRGKKVEVVGISYSEWHTAENLAAKLRGSRDAYSIGVVHCTVDTIMKTGLYAPCSMGDLLGKGIDYWALGHIHKRTVLRESDPVVVYPGNIQGRRPNESGEKGCYVVSVEDGRASLEFMATQSILWEDVNADITGKTDLGELVRSVNVPEGSFVSVSFTGKGPLNAAVREDPGEVVSEIAARCGCHAELGTVTCAPEVDVELLRRGETLMSEIIKVSEDFGNLSDEQIIDMLCTGPAADLREDLELLAYMGELKPLLAEAELSLLSRISGGSE